MQSYLQDYRLYDYAKLEITIIAACLIGALIYIGIFLFSFCIQEKILSKIETFLYDSYFKNLLKAGFYKIIDFYLLELR